MLKNNGQIKLLIGIDDTDNAISRGTGYHARQLKEELGLDEIASLQGESPTDSERVLINEWVRPLLKGHKTILITQRTLNHDDYEWELTGKETIRSIS